MLFNFVNYTRADCKEAVHLIEGISAEVLLADRGYDSDIVPMQDLFNEWHAKNTSDKVKKVMQSKGISGVPLTVNLPYGYKKSAEEKGKWEIDEPAAEVVRKIFQLCVNGLGPTQIARRLKAERLLWYVQVFEKQFAQEQMERFGLQQKRELAAKRLELEKARQRVTEIDHLIQKSYEDLSRGLFSEERFAALSLSLENEQRQLRESIPIMED